VVDAAAVPDPNQVTNKGKVAYTWTTGQTDTPGDYFYRWRIEVATGKWQSTPESPLVVLSYAPGGSTRIGAIADYLRDIIPVTYQAMIDSNRFGPLGIQRQIDVVKTALFASVCLPAAEATLYTPLVLDYAARVAAIRIIPPAVDFWGDVPTAVTTTGTNEVQSFPDRVENLWDIFAVCKAIIGSNTVIDGVVVSRSIGMPAISLLGKNKVTPDPSTFPAPFDSEQTIFDVVR
jgi:hypothetical protein